MVLAVGVRKKRVRCPNLQEAIVDSSPVTLPLSTSDQVHRNVARAAGPVACDRRGSDPSSSGSVSPFHAGLSIEISIDKRPLAVGGFVCGRFQGSRWHPLNFERNDPAAGEWRFGPTLLRELVPNP